MKPLTVLKINEAPERDYVLILGWRQKRNRVLTGSLSKVSHAMPSIAAKYRVNWRIGRLEHVLLLSDECRMEKDYSKFTRLLKIELTKYVRRCRAFCLLTCLHSRGISSTTLFKPKCTTEYRIEFNTNTLLRRFQHHKGSRQW